MSVSAREATYSMTMSPPPPADLGSYSRSMHQHTKQQMEAASQSSSSPPSGRRSQSTSQGPPRSHQSSAGPSAMPNGVSVSNASSGMGSSGRGPAGYN